MKSKPTNIQANGTWKLEKFNLLMYAFDIVMEDGNTGQYSSSKFTDMNAANFPFKVGTEVEYEFFPDKDHPKIKLPKKDFQPSFQFNGKKDDVQLMIVKQSSLKCAADVLIKNCDQVKADDVIQLADKFTKWVMDIPKTPEIKVETKVEPKPEPKPISVSELQEDDLPF
tara:strand:+ start:87 stop:593 length:507 start_codon:yes stop_codon:yes gene_type:complete